MAVLSLKVLPDPILRKKARPVAKVDQAIGTLISDMLATMRAVFAIESLRDGLREALPLRPPGWSPCGTHPPEETNTTALSS